MSPLEEEEVGRWERDDDLGPDGDGSEIRFQSFEVKSGAIFPEYSYAQPMES